MKKRIELLAIALIILVGSIVYANSLNGKFILDDVCLVDGNEYIKNFSRISKFFMEDIGAGGGGYFGFYRPFQMITYAIDYSLWGLDVKGYHLTNILLHVMVALTIYWLINILYTDKVLSLLTSLIFIVHPVHTEAVAYISGRADLLVALFMLICFIFYIKQIHSKNLSGLLIMIASYTLALLSRESSLILPVLLVLYHYAFKKKIKAGEFLIILGIAFVYIALRITALRSLLPHISSHTTLLQRVPGFFVAIANYFRLLLVPVDLHMEYGQKLFALTDPRAVIGIVLLFSLITYAVIKRNSDRLTFFSIAWFFITLLPVSNLYPLNAYMAEHWLYLPAIGLFPFLMAKLTYLYRIKRFQTFAALFSIITLVSYSYFTIKQNNYWKEPVNFYARTLKYAPESSRFYNNLGYIYITIGENKEAIALLKKAIKVNPRDIWAYNNLGRAYTATGSNQEAIAIFKKAIEISPNVPETHNNLAVSYCDESQYDLAIKHIDRATQLGFKNPALLEILKPYRK